MYKVQVGYYAGKENAEKMARKLAGKGIPAFIWEE
jgi:cell division septation protein DedD